MGASKFQFLRLAAWKKLPRAHACDGKKSSFSRAHPKI
jgi:hypothetical protein